MEKKTYQTPHMEERELEMDLFLLETSQEQEDENTHEEGGDGKDLAKFRGLW